MARHPADAPRLTALPVLFLGVLLQVAAGCGSTGDQGPAGPAGPQGPAGPPGEPPIVLGPDGSLPGVVISVLSVSGGSGPSGGIRIGDHPKVTFTVKTRDGRTMPPDQLAAASALVSGPTRGYQRVLKLESDVHQKSVQNADGSLTYTFEAPVPAAYEPPYNDTSAFGPDDGERQGEALEAGTYTLGIEAYATYSIRGTTVRDSGNATFDFLIGDGATLEPHPEVVKEESCNQCHSSLEAHGSIRNELSYCLLCHTAGAEDRNVTTVAGGTPGVTVDFGVMIHRLHNAAHLPSVLGVATDPNGNRVYNATPKPYEMIGFGDRVLDFSELSFPVMPSAYVSYLFDTTGTTYTGAAGNGPMPRNVGFTLLTPAQRLLDDKIRTGTVACEKCHGDPDGSGPLTAPAAGQRHLTEPTRKSCGSCHDDIDWNKTYVANGMTMPAQPNDNACTLCHGGDSTPVPIATSHLHPYSDPALNPGVEFAISAVGGGTGPGGKHRKAVPAVPGPETPGDPVVVTFGVKDRAGANVNLQKLTRFQMMVTGPSTNPQVVVNTVIPNDTGFRKASPFTGGGSIGGLSIAAGATAQTIAVVFTGATTFDVRGSVSAPLAGQTLDGAGKATVTYAGVTFTVSKSGADFANEDRFYFEVVPTADSYTMTVPTDVTFERVGTATGGGDVFKVANLPLYWGRQVVFERTATGAAGAAASAVKAGGRFVVGDASSFGLAVNDRAVIESGTGTEEYLTVGRIQTTDDWTGADLGTNDRIWFTTPLRYDHPSGATVQKATLTARREGTQYVVSDSATGEITLTAGQFTSGNPVVVSYRTHGRFGLKPAPGKDPFNKYSPAAADSEDINVTWGDWNALDFVDGTYQVGLWAHREFTVTPAHALTTTEAWNTWNSDNTTYRSISPPANMTFLFGSATTLAPRQIIASGAVCDTCHGDLQAHGNGRRGFETCINCHASPGMEDGPKYTFSSWYVGPTPGASMDFRSLLHKVHMGKELAKAESYVVNGVFLGIPYEVHAEGEFPSMPGAAKDCTKCHGNSSSWKEPATRDHPLASGTPTQVWTEACGSCHDSDEATAHIGSQTSNGVETCQICHGIGREFTVEASHHIP
jgi:hypothetical protein